MIIIKFQSSQNFLRGERVLCNGIVLCNGTRLKLPLPPTLVVFCFAVFSFPEAVMEQQVVNSQDFILLCLKEEEGKKSYTLAIAA